MTEPLKELKECPFCGGNGILSCSPIEIGCDKCGFWFETECETEAINIWNTRSIANFVLPDIENIRYPEKMFTPVQQGWNACIDEFKRLNQKEV